MSSAKYLSHLLT